MSKGKKVSRRGRANIQIGGNPTTPSAKIGILAGVALAAGAIAIFHSAAVMGGIALFLIILWVIVPKKKKQ